MKALVIGATGATGKDLVNILLTDTRYTEVAVFVRRSPDLQHEKLHVHVVDFDRPDEWAALVQGDVAFSCLGTTLKAAGGKQAQWKVDHDYQYHFARAARANGVAKFVLVSSAGASAGSLIFYSRMKGELEDKIAKLDFDQALIFRPGPLVRPDTDRPGEKTGIAVIRFLNNLGLLKSQKPLPTATLAAAMVNAPERKGAGFQRIKTPEIFSLSV